MASQNPNLLSVQSFKVLGRALFVSDVDLTAEESASTLFRFFRSKHVVDLKLIFTLALFVLAAHIGTVMYYRFALQHKVGVISYIAPAVPIYTAIVAWAYLSAAKRLGVVDLFACEISTLCRVGTIFDMGKGYVEMYRRGAVADKRSTSSSAYVSQEDYFPIFDKNSDDLQALEALVVSNITEFYTYMKAARDSQRNLAATAPPEAAIPVEKSQADPWHAALANVIYMVFIGYESGRKAVKDLIEFEPTEAENTIVILLTELPCYCFLCEYFMHDELRFNRLKLRESYYKKEVPELYRMVVSHGDDEEFWVPAKRTALELVKRYKETFGEDLNEAVHLAHRTSGHPGATAVAFADAQDAVPMPGKG
jgi:hypothetical protein